MKWRLDLPHQIDEQVLDAGTIIGDDTQWPFTAPKDDPKVKDHKGRTRKKGDPLPPSTNMSPVDDEARKVYEDLYGKDGSDRPDPNRSIPLTGAPGAPKIMPPETRPVALPLRQPVNQAPTEPPKTGMIAEGPKVTPDHPSTPTPKV